LAVLALLATLPAAVFVLEYERFFYFSILQLSGLAYLVLVWLLLVVTDWGRGRRWQRLVAAAVALTLLLEAALQVVAAAGALPLTTTYNAGMSVPYGRILYNAEGFGNGMTNQFGWYAPPFRLDADKQRVVLIGDGLVEGLQVARDETMGAVLDDLLGPEVEVIAMGASGFGPAQYYELTKHALTVYDPDEIVIIFNSGDDYLNVLRNRDPRRPQDHVYYELDNNGYWNLVPDSYSALHFLTHFFENAQRPFYQNAVRTVRSYLLLPKLLTTLGEAPLYRHRVARPERELWADPDFAVRGFAFDAAEPDAAEAQQITEGLLGLIALLAETQGVRLRLVSVPAFPTAALSGDVLLTTIGSLDLRLPERQLTTFAAAEAIDYLPLAHRLIAEEASPRHVASLFFNEGQGHLTPAGHAFVAEAIQRCFFVADASCQPN
jgi:hypothetical protein